MRKEKPRPQPWAEKIKDLHGIDGRFITRRIEWWCEWASYGLSRWAFLEVLEYIGKLGILIAIITFFYPGCKERRQAVESAKQAAADARISRHYVAWQTLNSAFGKPGNAGRADALRDLSQDGVAMNGISLAGHVVLVGPLNVTNAQMAHADFTDAEFENVNFSHSEFMLSKWDNASSFKCDFRGASFWGVDFKNAHFSLCDFGFTGEGKNQRLTDFYVNFQSDEISRFDLCNFSGAVIPMGIWNSAYFEWCNFAYAQIWQPFIGKNASIEFCNLYGATTASKDFIKWAYHQRVVFTNVTTLEQWHYCVTNRLDYQAGSADFMQWASNNFNTYIVTNNPQAWIDWSRENLKSQNQP